MAREKMDLRRTTIFVYTDQWEKMKQLAAERRIPVSYLLREAVDQYLKRNHEQ